ncbi:Family S53 protease-like protein [Mycena indigotica]|uniref:tripeptidyl-peptidase II n=1 Tax=Mycena indigotica TaxID=2126181 RepID=A0A8H6SWB3_9AGAR|nr:Family S53 protease-like protein [Mycena indigotica]KAF7306473.1 Family S53 protease-like protein [Mycena indigotica]
MVLRYFLNVLSIFGAASAASMVLHERRSTVPAEFTNKGAAAANEVITLRVGLAQNNIAGLQDKLLSISTPGSSEFRQWLSMEEVKSFVEPSTETLAAFHNFASANGLKTSVISPNGDWVSIDLPVSQANKLFAANFQKFSHASLTEPLIRTLSVSLPQELVGHVEVLHPTTEFTTPNPRLGPIASMPLPADKRATVPASCNSNVATGVITPACLQDLYGIPTTPATEKSSTLLVTGYVGQFAQSADLSSFLKLLRPDIPSTTTFALQTLDRGTNPQGASQAGVEANLDIQYTTGIATDVPVSFLTVGGNSFSTALLDTTTFLDGVASPPSVMTTSYGDTEANFGNSLATRICNGYMALGARGITVAFASGDGGVRGNHDSTSVCNNNVFMPVFPAACPFLTSVGSTQGSPVEKAINFTGGGFSNVFTSPAYQTAQVASFLATVPANFKGTFNRAGRGYPDVALQGWNFEIVSGGVTGLVGGTSASSPSFAGLVALINDKLVAAGKPTLGFLNPFLYANEGAFTDITAGHNSGFVCPATSVAFDAVAGWDALTGLGTPIFSSLLAAALA